MMRAALPDLLEKQIYDDARQEARRPTTVPDGELRQVTRYDASGRPYYDFFGSPRAWRDNFAAPKKRLIGILDNRNWQKV
jgi:hypothetical protein